MSEEKKESPKKEKEVKVLKANKSLKDEIGNLMSLDKILHDMVITKAEKKIEQNVNELRGIYDSLLDHYMFYLRGACNELKEDGSDKKQCLDDIQQTALSIKSSASLFNYDMAEKFATSLYLLVPKITKYDEKLYVIIESYTNCLELIVSRKVVGTDNRIAKELLKEFELLVNQEQDL